MDWQSKFAISSFSNTGMIDRGKTIVNSNKPGDEPS